MSDRSRPWRLYPEGQSAQVLLKAADDARQRGDLIEAGNWYVHAARLGAPEARERLSALESPIAGLTETGDIDAKVLLAGILLITDSDIIRARSLFSEAADLGVPEAKREMGFMLINGIGGPKDPAQANSYLRSAVECGDSYAAYNLAVNYRKGDGVEPDPQEYLRLLRIAAEGGVPEACALLGDELSAADQDSEAFRWYLRAAISGHAPAMFVVGCWYRGGVGTPVNGVQAIRWFLSMLDRGNGDGIHQGLDLARYMTADQVREAGRLAGREADAELLLRHR
jgi:TPR repeat protein